MRKSASIHNLFFKFYLDTWRVSRNVLCCKSLLYVVHWLGWSELYSTLYSNL